MQQPPAVVGEAEVVAGAAVLVGVAASLRVGGGVGAAAPLSPAAPVTVPGVPGCPTAGQSFSHWGSLGFKASAMAPQGAWWSSLPDCKEVNQPGACASC